MEESINKKLIAVAIKLLQLAESDTHLTDKGLIMSFIADDLKATGKTAIEEHEKQLSQKP